MKSEGGVYNTNTFGFQNFVYMSMLSIADGRKPKISQFSRHKTPWRLLHKFVMAVIKKFTMADI
jgi:hypothetical protein